ncbi:hypothetical protein C8R44DRAFT_760618 [Mycena epipterygia]|nr:hypothetical protein C8R44DRAFT_760618 [Mycena epipterygia]
MKEEDSLKFFSSGASNSTLSESLAHEHSLHARQFLLSENDTDKDPTRRKNGSHWRFLPAMCLVLHIGLVLLHVVLLIIGVKNMEHNVAFGIELQSRISFAITAVTTGIGIAYLTSALFVTQKLAMYQNLQSEQTLTATHDNVASWNGLGSAISILFRQRDVPASILGTLAIVGYLGCISSLHITTPALFSVAAFNMSVPHTVQTLGVPDFNTSANFNPTAEFISMALGFLPHTQQRKISTYVKITA